MNPTLCPLEGGTHIHVFASGLAFDEPSAFGTLSIDDTLTKEAQAEPDARDRLKVSAHLLQITKESMAEETPRDKSFPDSFGPLRFRESLFSFLNVPDILPIPAPSFGPSGSASTVSGELLCEVRLVCQKPECDVIVKAACIGKNRLVPWDQGRGDGGGGGTSSRLAILPVGPTEALGSLHVRFYTLAPTPFELFRETLSLITACSDSLR